MDRLILKIADIYLERIQRRKIFTKEELSDKDFIFRTNLYNVLACIIMFFVGLMINCVVEMTTLMIVFNILRNDCGGYHSYNSLNNCLIISIVSFSIICLIAKYAIINNPLGLFLIAIGCSLLIFINAPYGTEKEDVSLEYKHNALRKIDFGILCFFFLVFSLFMPNNIAYTIWLGIIWIWVLTLRS